MITIRELGRMFGLSRTALLYYDRIGLLQPVERSDAGYRLYNDSSVERLKRICAFRNAGLALTDIKGLLEAPSTPDRSIIERRIRALDTRITQMKVQQRTLAAMLEADDGSLDKPVLDRHIWHTVITASGMDETMMKRWHLAFELNAPEAHHAFLTWLGFTEREVHEIRMLSHSIRENSTMMEWFMKVFRAIPRQGPGTTNATLKAWDTIRDQLPEKPVILDVGCGSGASTMVLAEQSDANITALDNDPGLLAILERNAVGNKQSATIKTVEGTMTSMPFEHSTFDCIWAEGSIFIIGVERGLREWKPLLKQNGFLVMSEMVWFTDEPSSEIKGYFDRIYPNIGTFDGLSVLAESLGYTVIDTFALESEGWSREYYKPMAQRIDELEALNPGDDEANTMFAQLREEIDMYKKYGNEYGYAFFILKV